MIFVLLLMFACDSAEEEPQIKEVESTIEIDTNYSKNLDNFSEYIFNDTKNDEKEIKTYTQRYNFVPFKKLRLAEDFILHIKKDSAEYSRYREITLKKSGIIRYKDTIQGEFFDNKIIVQNSDTFYNFAYYIQEGSNGNRAYDYNLYDVNQGILYSYQYTYWHSNGYEENLITHNDNLKKRTELLPLFEKFAKKNEIKQDTTEYMRALIKWDNNNDSIKVKYTVPCDSREEVLSLHGSSNEYIENDRYLVVSFFKGAVVAWDKKKKEYFIIERDYSTVISLNNVYLSKDGNHVIFYDSYQIDLRDLSLEYLD